MTNWVDRAAAALMSLSRANTLAEAMREWNTTGGAVLTTLIARNSAPGALFLSLIHI